MIVTCPFSELNSTLTHKPIFKIKVEPANAEVRINETVVFYCDVFIDAANISHENIHWLHNGQELKLPSSLNLFTDDNNSLIINHAQYRNTGEYTCVVPTEQGLVKGTAFLNIKRIKPYFFNGPENRTIFPEYNVEIPCKINSDDYKSTNVKWMKDNQQISFDNNDHYYKYDDRMEISQVKESDEGWYNCIVTADNYTLEKTGYFDVDSIPRRPTDLKVGCNKDLIALMWNSNSNDVQNILYEIEYKSMSSPNSSWTILHKNISTRANTYDTRIAHKDYYQFRLTARNIHGTSEPSEPSGECLAGLDVLKSQPTIDTYYMNKNEKLPNETFNYSLQNRSNHIKISGKLFYFCFFMKSYWHSLISETLEEGAAKTHFPKYFILLLVILVMIFIVAFALICN